MTNRAIIGVLFVSFWLLFLLAVYFAFQSFNTSALLGDLTRFNPKTQTDDPELIQLKFWCDFYPKAFWATLCAIPLNVILYVICIRRENRRFNASK